MIWPQIRVSRCRKPFGQPLWKIHGFPENLWFSIEPYQIPRIWRYIRVSRCRKPFGQPLWKIHGFPENLWFYIEPYQIPRIWPYIRVSRCRKPFGQPLWKIHGFPENLWFPRKPLVFHRTIPDTKDLTSYSSSSMSKILRSTLMGTSWYLSKSMFFWPLRTDKQASRQFMFARFFSTRKRISTIRVL